MKCALLGWSAFKDAVLRAQSRSQGDTMTDTQQHRPSDLVRDDLPSVELGDPTSVAARPSRTSRRR